MRFEPSEAELSGRRFMSLSEPAKALWYRAGFWCESSGERLVSIAMIKGWGSNKRAADELAGVALWGVAGDEWLVPEREESLSSKRARAGRQGGLAKASKPPSKPLATDLANTKQTAGKPLANSGFASLANAGLVPPLASPSPDSESGFSSDSPADSSSFQLSSEGSEPSPARAPKRRMRRCPDGFELDETGKKLAAELRVDWVAEGQKFRDWEFKDPKSDWQATARTWIRNAAERARGAGVPMGRNGRPQEVSANVDHDTRKALHASRRVREFLEGAK